jgi:hypothetical protein
MTQGSEQAPPEPLDAAILFAPVGSLVPIALKAVRPGGIVVCALHAIERQQGRWETINHALVMASCEDGREASPTAGVIDSQSAKTCESGGPRGFDSGKKIISRRRHIATPRAI